MAHLTDKYSMKYCTKKPVHLHNYMQTLMYISSNVSLAMVIYLGNAFNTSAVALACNLTDLLYMQTVQSMRQSGYASAIATKMSLMEIL